MLLLVPAGTLLKALFVPQLSYLPLLESSRYLILRVGELIMFIFIFCSLTRLFAFLLKRKAVICLHRKVAHKDKKVVYWIAGGIAGLSVLLEKKARRSELALYVLPRAVDSLGYILVNRHLVPKIKKAEVKFTSSGHLSMRSC